MHLLKKIKKIKSKILKCGFVVLQKISEQSSTESSLERKLCLNKYFMSLGLCKKTETLCCEEYCSSNCYFVDFLNFVNSEGPSASQRWLLQPLSGSRLVVRWQFCEVDSSRT